MAPATGYRLDVMNSRSYIAGAAVGAGAAASFGTIGAAVASAPVPVVRFGRAVSVAMAASGALLGPTNKISSKQPKSYLLLTF